MNYTENKNLSDSIHRRLIDAINFSGMTKTEIARKVGITSATISSYIHKNKMPSVETFALICEAIDVSADEILGLKQ